MGNTLGFPAFSPKQLVQAVVEDGFPEASLSLQNRPCFVQACLQAGDGFIFVLYVEGSGALWSAPRSFPSSTIEMCR